MDTKATYATDASTLGESTDDFETEGFTGQFAALDDAMVRCFSCHESMPATEVHLAGLKRTEGASDPDDMVAIAAITCPKCGTEGTLVIKYGADASPEEADVLRLLEDSRTPGSGGVSAIH